MNKEIDKIYTTDIYGVVDEDGNMGHTSDLLEATHRIIPFPMRSVETGDQVCQVLDLDGNIIRLIGVPYETLVELVNL